VLLASLLAVSCSGGVTERAAIASAKCVSALHERLHLAADDTSLRLVRAEVSELGHGSRRVAGLAVYGAEQSRVFSGEFVCEVTRDDTDTLRHLRVTRLEWTSGAALS
jgi:hypothetical protein